MTLRTPTLASIPHLTLLVILVVVWATVSAGASEAGPTNEIMKLTALDAEAGDYFGHSVAISREAVLVGAPVESAGAGATYVFQRDLGGLENWSEATKLIASDAEPGDVFGASVAIDRDTIVVGAQNEDTAGNRAGAAYVFQREHGGPDNWGEVAKLTPSDAHVDGSFGVSVAVSGDFAVVGASNAAYIFQREDGSDVWREVAKLTAFDVNNYGLFGGAVAISDGTVVVGDYGAGTGGSAYVYERDKGGSGDWGRTRELTGSGVDSGDHFGISVAVEGDTVVVGSSFDQVEGVQSGVAYVFGRDTGGANSWGEVRKLTASDAEAGDRFGHSVSISADSAVVGAFWEAAGGHRAGAAYTFNRDGGGTVNWRETGKLSASDAEASDEFGWSVAVDGSTAVAGARNEDALGDDAGAAYVFQLTKAVPSPTTQATGTSVATVTPAVTEPPPVPTSLPPVGAPPSGTPSNMSPILLAVVGSVVVISAGYGLLHARRQERIRL